ncbi:hypothetical protein [Undibacterium sp.]|uniref:hypothetical protein n=1 Tax=Undibacterium sp. TaxID=1914977 RepID=UPI002D091F5A|nr:hypothetical protein [Undibacterium sp.]HTD06346.1 hypothetical protein [Undibacterium sp.]
MKYFGADQLKDATAIFELLFKVLSCGALVGGGIWAYYQFQIGGARDWVSNMSIETQVLPYKDDLRLVVVHVKLKNPRPTELDIDRSSGSYKLLVRKIPDGLKSGAVIHEGEGELIAKVDLFPADGLVLLPNSELGDMASVVLPAGTTVAFTADLEFANGTKTKDGKPDHDFVSVSTITQVKL